MSTSTLPPVKMADFRFYRDHAGYIVGRNAECAIELARAAQLAEDSGYTFDWEYDDDGYLADNVLGIPSNERPREYLACTMYDMNDNALESLCGIGDPDNDYRRVVEAELASDHFYPVLRYAQSLAAFMARIGVAA